MLVDLIVAFGALATGLGSFVASIVSARRAGAAKDSAEHAATEVSPNHGSSLKDQISRIEAMVRSQGHQIGEIRRDSAITHHMLANQVDDHADRIVKLESRSRRDRNSS